MRKIIAYSLIAILAALTFAGCSDHFTPASESDGHGLTFSITVPDAGAIATRSFSEEAITSLHVLVFDENGYFVECQKAQPTEPASFGTDMNTEYKFSVNLQASPNKRILHFVANYDFEKNPVEYGTEYSVISHLTVGDGQEAYWQRVVLEEGIYEKFDDMPEKGKLVKIPLVRNFAKVVVESKIENFEVLGYALWNVPDKGSVAPCVLASQAFATYAKQDGDPGDSYGNNPWVCRAYDDLSAHYADDSESSGYKGYLPKDATIVSTNASSLTFDNNAKYMYERPFSDDETNTAIIVYGKYKGNRPSFYKIDLVMPPKQGVSEHYNILRNFTFKAKIVGCSADGYESAQEAAMNPASNNFMASVVTQDVINISDGTARLFVTYTDTTIVSSDPFVFRYKYYPDFKSKPNVVGNDSLSFYDLTRRDTLTRDDKDQYDVKLKSPYFVMTKYNVIEEVASGPWAGWHQTTITPDTPTDEERSESVIIYQMTKDNNQVKIARTVTFRLRKPFTMILECKPATVLTGVGQNVKVNIKIPSGLRESLFPLEFKLEAENNSLSPDNTLTADKYRSGYMSTWYGKSIIPNNGKQDNVKQSYGFTKTLSYNEYLSMALTDDNSYRIVPCAFVTTKSNSATKVWIQNKYFYFGNGQSTASFVN